MSAQDYLVFRPAGRIATLLGILLSAIFISAHARPFGAAAADLRSSDPQSGIQVKIESGLLTLDVDGAPLSEVLRSISEQAGFKLLLKGDLNRPTSLAFSNLPLHRALRRVLGRTPYLTVQDPNSSSSENGSLLEVRVYGAGQGQSRAPVIEQRHKAPKDGSDPAPQAPSKTKEDMIIAKLGHSDRAARILAVRMTGELQNDAASQILQRVLSEDRDATVKSYAIRMLRSLAIEEQTSIEVLQYGLEDEERVVRLEAVRALSRIHDERALGSLEQVVLQDPDPQIRRFAVQALGARKSETARSILEKASEDADPIVRRIVKFSLEKWH